MLWPVRNFCTFPGRNRCANSSGHDACYPDARRGHSGFSSWHYTGSQSRLNSNQDPVMLAEILARKPAEIGSLIPRSGTPM
jgi:hypothetical protein